MRSGIMPGDVRSCGRSETVTLVVPVVPVRDGKARALFGADGNKLGEGHDEFTLVVQCMHEDGNAAQLIMRESEDGDSVT